MPSRDELLVLQALPLDLKVAKSKLRIREFFDRCDGEPIISFSGGKDSTVLLHLVRSVYPNTPAVFADTGLEYPELREFVKTFDNVVWVKPKSTFRQTIEKYGYPIISKEVAEKVYFSSKGKQWALNHMNGLSTDGQPDENKSANKKYLPLVEAPFMISHRCCNVMKKNPFKKIKDTPMFLGTLADESRLRRQKWLKHGCNAFEVNQQKSMPLSFWTEQDILQYIRLNNLPVASVYGDLVCADKDEDGNALFDLLFSDCDKLEFTECQRTGCVFCGFGTHLEKGESRFERLKRTHPNLYNYCINGGAFDPDDGLWKPNGKGLGMGFVFDWCNENINNFKIKY